MGVWGVHDGDKEAKRDEMGGGLVKSDRIYCLSRPSFFFNKNWSGWHNNFLTEWLLFNCLVWKFILMILEVTKYVLNV